MKKIIAAMLIAAMSLSLVACGNKSSENTNESSSEQQAAVAENATALLQGAYEKFDENLAALGGGADGFMGGYYDENDETTLVQGGPGAIPVENPNVISVGLLPEANVAMVDDAALVQHGMMLNFFAAAAFRVTDSANVETVAAALDEAIKNNMWMCGQPEGYVIITIGNYVVSTYGLNDNINSLKDALTATYESAKVAFEGSLME